MRYTALSLVIGLTAFGCTATGGNNVFPSGGGGSGQGGSGSSQGGVGGANFTGSVGSGSGMGGGSSAGCDDAAKLVYVLSEENDLYSFRPDLKQFKKIGPLGCQANGAQPNSMAVDRNAVAWVNYVTPDDAIGSIFQVSTVDASCKPTSISLTSGWTRLGMGFSTDVAGGTSETLFIAGTGGQFGPTSPGLGKIDFAKMSVTPVGPFTGALNGQNAELTGTGDARLFGFFTTTPVQVAEINKASGAIKMTKPFPQVQTPSAWAFSFWGGDFYLYTAPADPTVTTTVSRYRPSDGTVIPAYMTSIGFRIVGAGVSTCAPLVPPPPPK